MLFYCIIWNYRLFSYFKEYIVRRSVVKIISIISKLNLEIPILITIFVLLKRKKYDKQTD